MIQFDLSPKVKEAIALSVDELNATPEQIVVDVMEGWAAFSNALDQHAPGVPPSRTYTHDVDDHLPNRKIVISFREDGARCWDGEAWVMRAVQLPPDEALRAAIDNAGMGAAQLDEPKAMQLVPVEAEE